MFKKIAKVLPLVGTLALAQTSIQEKQLPPALVSQPGPFFRMIVNMISTQVKMDPTAFSVGVDGTGIPTLFINPAILVPSTVSVKNKEVPINFTGTPINLPDTPVANTVVLVFANGVKQNLGVDYTINGATITPTPAANDIWLAASKIRQLSAVYFY